MVQKLDGLESQGEEGGALIHVHVRLKRTYEKSNAYKIYFRRLINTGNLFQFIFTKREGQLHGLVIYSHKQISL